MEKNVVHAYIGCGKGKTTAAFGLALRALGHGEKVSIHQFLKQFISGEALFLRGHADIFCYGISGFYFSMTDAEKQLLKEKTLNGFKAAAKDLKSGEYFLIVLDEVLGAIEIGLIEVSDLIKALENTNNNTNVVITGRVLPKELYEKLDLITEMKNVKHYYKKGIKSKRGIEY
ncbi:MAG: cob(I)yrinic acid a,c-diamide adenosyltransferase [Eubacteriales bacterium]